MLDDDQEDGFIDNDDDDRVENNDSYGQPATTKAVRGQTVANQGRDAEIRDREQERVEVHVSD